MSYQFRWFHIRVLTNRTIASNGPSHLQQRPGSATSPPRTSSSLPEAGTAKKRPHADIDNSEKRGRAPPILASSAQDAQTSSGSATPAGFASRRDPPRTPSYNDSVSDPKPTQKRSKSVGRSSSMGKGTTSGGEEERARANAKAGGSHSSKARGKSTAYQARVDPAVLQLVKYAQQLTKIVPMLTPRTQSQLCVIQRRGHSRQIPSRDSRTREIPRPAGQGHVTRRSASNQRARQRIWAAT